MQSCCTVLGAGLCSGVLAYGLASRRHLVGNSAHTMSGRQAPSDGTSRCGRRLLLPRCGPHPYLELQREPLKQVWLETALRDPWPSAMTVRAGALFGTPARWICLAFWPSGPRRRPPVSPHGEFLRAGPRWHPAGTVACPHRRGAAAPGDRRCEGIALVFVRLHMSEAQPQPILTVMVLALSLLPALSVE